MLKRISTNQLREGMFLHELCGSWMDHPFWRARFLIADSAELRRIADSGIAEAWIDTARGLDVAGSAEACEVEAEVERELAAVAAQVQADVGADPGHSGGGLPDEDPDGELRRAALICAQAKEQVRDLFNDARLGRAIDAGTCLPMIDAIEGSVRRDRGALISVARLKQRDEYTYLHSVAVATLMIALARQLHWSDDAVRAAGLAGLLHDIGKARVPIAVLNKAGRLSDREFAQMKSHPELGHAALRAGGVTEAMALDVCLHHHERVDGSGYPHRLSGEALSLVARMGAVCDVYDAVTSCRPYKDAWGPAEALRKMAQWKGHFDARVFQTFVRTVGIYPAGSLVRLESGRLGVVLGQSGESLLTPRVRVIYCTHGERRLAPVDVDLAAAGCDERITGVESPQRWRLTGLESLWREAG